MDDVESSDAPHVPVPLSYDERLVLFRDLDEVAKDVLLEGEPYRRLAERVRTSQARVRQVTQVRKRLTKQDCVELRAQISNLGYGQAEAESRSLFARRLHPISEHLRALDPNVVLVVGPRGSGKSELFSVFFTDNDDLGEAIMRYAPGPAGFQIKSSSAKWKRAHPAATGFPDNRVLAQQIDSDAAAKTLWYVMLVRTLADELDCDSRKRLDPFGTAGRC